MLDYNILNRATFDDKEIRHEVRMAPHIFEGGNVLELGPGTVYWVKEITWNFGYFDVGMYGAKKVPIQNIEVCVGNILRNESAPFPPFDQPKPQAERIDFKVKNTNLANNMQLKVVFRLNGTLVTPKPGAPPLSYKEMLGYIMLSKEKKGELALNEAAVDMIDEKMKSMGMDSIRDKLPFGLGTVATLPAPLKALMLGISNSNNPSLALGGEEETSNLKRLALDADPKKDKSAFIGDFIAGSPTSCQVNKEDLLTIADHMISQGWRKLS